MLISFGIEANLAPNSVVGVLSPCSCRRKPHSSRQPRSPFDFLMTLLKRIPAFQLLVATLVALTFSSLTEAKIPEAAFVPNGPFSGPTYIDLTVYPTASYDLTLNASIVLGGSDYADTACFFGGFSTSGWGYWGESNCGISFQNIHATRPYDNSSWVADVVEVWVQEPGAEWYDHTYYYNVAINPTGVAGGWAHCGGASQDIYGYCTIYQ